MVKPKNTLDAIADDCDSSLNVFSRNLILMGAITLMVTIIAMMIITDREITDLSERLDSDIQLIEERLDSLEQKVMEHEKACNTQQQDLMEQLDVMKGEN